MSRLVIIAALVASALGCARPEARSEPTADPRDDGDGAETTPAPSSSAYASGGPPALAAQTSPSRACNALGAAVQSVTVMPVASAPPDPKGGTIADGVYRLAKLRRYVGANPAAGAGPSAPITERYGFAMSVHGTAADVGFSQEGAAPESTSWSVAFAGAELTQTQT